MVSCYLKADLHSLKMYTVNLRQPFKILKRSIVHIPTGRENGIIKNAQLTQQQKRQKNRRGKQRISSMNIKQRQGKY